LFLENQSEFHHLNISNVELPGLRKERGRSSGSLTSSKPTAWTPIWTSRRIGPRT
jgi:hypothetical protein